MTITNAYTYTTAIIKARRNCSPPGLFMLGFDRLILFAPPILPFAPRSLDRGKWLCLTQSCIPIILAEIR